MVFFFLLAAQVPLFVVLSLGRLFVIFEGNTGIRMLEIQSRGGKTRIPHFETPVLWSAPRMLAVCLDFLVMIHSLLLLKPIPMCVWVKPYLSSKRVYYRYVLISRTPITWTSYNRHTFRTGSVHVLSFVTQLA